jgi:serine/threonine protein kinase
MNIMSSTNNDPLGIIGETIFTITRTRKYVVKSFLAQGAFSKVYLADLFEWNGTDFEPVKDKIVLKVFDPKDKEELDVEEINAINEQEFYNEKQGYDLLSKYPECNAYVVCLYDAMNWNDDTLSRKYALALQLMDGDLTDIANGTKKELTKQVLSNPNLVLDMIEQLLEGLVYVHSKDLILSDIKEENIFYQVIESLDGNVPEKIIVKYGDLGLMCKTTSAFEAEEDRTIKPCKLSGTIDYISPDYIELVFDYGVDDAPYYITNEIAKKNDVWALGVTLRHLILDTHPIQSVEELLTDETSPPTPTQIVNAIALAENVVPTNYELSNDKESKIIQDVIDKMIVLEAEERPTALELLEFVNEKKYL